MEAFHLERRGECGILHLHAGSANALNERTLAAIMAGLHEASAAQLKGLVVTGYERLFSAGLDLIRIYEYEREQMADFLAAFEEDFQRLFIYPKPIIAAINGTATAGGAILAFACDYRIMAEDAKIGLSEIQLGLPLPASALEIARHAIPALHHAQVFYSGKFFEAEEALHLGLVHEVAPRAQLLETAFARLQSYAAHPGEACNILKTALRAPVLEHMRQNAAPMREKFLQAWFGAEARRAISVIRERLKARKNSV